MNLPSGSVTFLAADIEGSAELRARNASTFQEAVRRYNTIAAEILPLHSGVVARRMGEGSALVALVTDPHEALGVARALLQIGQAEPWIGETPRLRISLHTGQAEQHDGHYNGPDMNHGLHLLAMAHGWQALVSAACVGALWEALPLGMQLRDLGEYLLFDLTQSEHVYQLLYPGLPDNFPPLRSLTNYPNNLPLHADRFIGRETEMEEVLQLLSGTRLLTLIGSAGMGKTRMAQQAAAKVLDAYPGGVWLVDFRSITEPSLVAQAVASALNVWEEPGKPLLNTLIAAIAPQRMLLVFDNCPPKLTACPRLADTLLRSCPHLQILATSRQGLGVAGESSYLLPPLSLPEDREVIAPAAVQLSEAAQLFLDRAVSVVPDFALNTVTSSAMARICRRLDGIPLALELAAAGLQAMSLDQLDYQLQVCFHQLFGEKPRLLSRQQTLHGAVEWAFDRLPAVEQALLCRLTVFRGGWTREAAQAVCAGEGVTSEQIAAGLTALRDAAMLIEEEFGSDNRYEMPEVVGEYCRPFLESEENMEAHRYHARFYLELAQQGREMLNGPEADLWFYRLEREQPNFRVALAWCQDDAECAEMGAWLAETLQAFWERRAYPSEGQTLLARLRGISRYDASERADALMEAGELAFRQGDYAVALARYEQALALHRVLEDRKKEADTLHHLGIVARETGYHVAAQERHEQALALHRELNDPVGEALHMHNLGNALRERGDYEGARHHYEQAYSRNWSAGNRMAAAHNLNGLARIAVALGDRDSAHRFFSEALVIFQEKQDAAWQAYNLREIVKLDLQPGLFWVENHK